MIKDCNKYKENCYCITSGFYCYLYDENGNFICKIIFEEDTIRNIFGDIKIIETDNEKSNIEFHCLTGLIELLKNNENKAKNNKNKLSNQTLDYLKEAYNISKEDQCTDIKYLSNLICNIYRDFIESYYTSNGYTKYNSIEIGDFLGYESSLVKKTINKMINEGLVERISLDGFTFIKLRRSQNVLS